jgi:hypothetical protein
VEYTFKNSLTEKVQTVILNQGYLVVQTADKEETIAYSNIRTVRLSRANGNTYRITLLADNHSSISISNKYYLPGGACEDRSRQYAAFVRVLHYHLKEKSDAIYSSGFSLNLLFAWLLISAFASVFVSFISEYLGLSLLNPFVQATVLTMLLMFVIFLMNRRRLPRTYSPSEIPFQFLP